MSDQATTTRRARRRRAHDTGAAAPRRRDRDTAPPGSTPYGSDSSEVCEAAPDWEQELLQDGAEECVDPADVCQPTTTRGRMQLPDWANSEARAYLEGGCFTVGDSARRFGEQVVWVRVREREDAQPQLVVAEMFEFFPRDRSFYVPYFPFRQPGTSPVLDVVTNSDDMWEALYHSYQLYNRDMEALVLAGGQQPSAARGFLAQLDERLYRMIIGAMIQLTTSTIAPSSGVHVAQTVQMSAQMIGQLLGSNPSLADAIMAEAGGAGAQ